MTRDVQVWQQGTLGENLERVGVSRRDFLSFCGKLAAAFTVGSVVGTDEAFAAPTAEEVAQRLEAVTKPNVVWLQLQECTGCMESTLRSGGTTVEEIVLNLLSVNYNELVMAASGDAALASMRRTADSGMGEAEIELTPASAHPDAGSAALFCTQRAYVAARSRAASGNPAIE